MVMADSPKDSINLERKRWIVLGCFCLLTMSNAMNWIAYAPISSVATDYFAVSAFELNLLSSVYMIVYACGAFPAAYFMESKNMTFGLRLAASLNFFGSVWRILPFPFESLKDEASGYHVYAFALIGQLFEATAQLFTLAIPPVLAQNWFGDHERVRATAIGALFNQLGICIGFYLPPAIVGEDPAKIPLLMIAEAGISFAAALPVFFFFKDKPDSPPSLSAIAKEKDRNADDEPTFIQAAKSAFKSRDFNILLVCFSICYGGFAAICTVVESTLVPYDYSTTQAGLYGSLNVAFGMAGAYIIGIIADRTKHYARLVFATLAGSFIAMLWFTLDLREGNGLSIGASQCFLGFFMTALVPVCLDLSLEITYPLPETLPTTALMVFSQIVGAIMVQIMTALIEDSPKSSNWFLTSLLLFGCLFFLLFRGERKRMAIESPSMISPTRQSLLPTISSPVEKRHDEL